MAKTNPYKVVQVYQKEGQHFAKDADGRRWILHRVIGTGMWELDRLPRVGEDIRLFILTHQARQLF